MVGRRLSRCCCAQCSGHWSAEGPSFYGPKSFLSFGATGDTFDVNGFVAFWPDIPQGATINSARIDFIAHSPSGAGAGQVDLAITAEDQDEAACVTSAADAESRTRTTASVAWEDLPLWTEGVVYSSPSLVSVLQEIVNRAGWVAENMLLFFIEDTTTPSGYFRNATSRPKLIYTYTP